MYPLSLSFSIPKDVYNDEVREKGRIEKVIQRKREVGESSSSKVPSGGGGKGKMFTVIITRKRVFFDFFFCKLEVTMRTRIESLIQKDRKREFSSSSTILWVSLRKSKS